MSLPYFPMYPTDFEAKTSHLTLEEDGAYNRLLRLMWMTPGCSLPDDDAWIMRRMRCDKDTFDRVVSPLIDEFMKRIGGRVVSPRLKEEFVSADVAHKKRVMAGKKGGRPAKPLKTKNSDESNAKAIPKQPEPEPEPDKRDTKVSPKKTIGHRLPKDWVLPPDYIDFAFSQGWEEPAFLMEADKFKDYWISKAGNAAVKVDWLATWRNWLRNSNSPKTTNGGPRNGRTNKSDRIRRIIKAGADGTSGKDWG